MRTQTHKLIYFPRSDEWNLFDLERDPMEMKSVHAEPEYKQTREKLAAEFTPLSDDEMKEICFILVILVQLLS